MTNLYTFISYDISNYDYTSHQDIKSFKKFLSDKFEKDIIIFDPFGNEYKKDNINKIKINNKKHLEYIMCSSMDFINVSSPDLLSQKEIENKILNQFKIDELLSKYLESKKDNLMKSLTICKEIIERTNNLKEDDEPLKNFEENFKKIAETDKECKKYINLIKQSFNQIEILSPNFKENFEEIERMNNQIVNEINEIKNNTLQGKPHFDTKDINELKNVFKNYDKIIKAKISKLLDNLEIIFTLETKLNELFIFAEKINFYINLGEIPNLYKKCKPKLEEELKRRCYFKYIYENIMNTIESDFISKEYIKRKNFIKNNCSLSENTKIEKKTIEILNELFDIEAERINEDLKEKINGNDISKIDSKLNDGNEVKKENNFDEDLLIKINNLQNNLKEVLDYIYSKNKSNNKKNNDNEDNSNLELNTINISEEKIKKEFNDKFKSEIEEIKKNLKNSQVSETVQQNIINIIENRIIKNISNLNETNYTQNNKNNNNLLNIVKTTSSDSLNESNFTDIYLSGFNNSENENYKNSGNNINKTAKYFIDNYSQYLWFYGKIYEYLSAYNDKSEKKSTIKLDLNDPCSLNNFFVEILNENIKLKEKLKQIKSFIF